MNVESLNFDSDRLEQYSEDCLKMVAIYETSIVKFRPITLSNFPDNCSNMDKQVHLISVLSSLLWGDKFQF